MANTKFQGLRWGAGRGRTLSLVAGAVLLVWGGGVASAAWRDCAASASKSL